jgi:hypothetical protein
MMSNQRRPEMSFRKEGGFCREDVIRILRSKYKSRYHGMAAF